jgi:hypothetical protein
VRFIDRMADQGVYTIFVKAVMLIRTENIYGPRLSTWVEALKKTGQIDASLSIDVRKLNTIMSRAPSFGSAMSRFDGSNQSGVFRTSYPQHQHYYHFTQPAKQVSYPSPLNGAWKERVMKCASIVLVIPSTRARPSTGPVTDNNDTIGNTIEDEQPCRHQNNPDY